jgi:hypothetical protein
MQYEAAKKSGDLDAEELNKLKKQAEEQLAIATKAQGDVDYLRKKNVKDNEANDRKVADNEKKINDERIKNAQDFRKRQAELEAARLKALDDEFNKLKEIRDNERLFEEKAYADLKAIEDKKTADDLAMKERIELDRMQYEGAQFAFNMKMQQQKDDEAEKDKNRWREQLASYQEYQDAFADATKSGLQGAADLVQAFAGKSVAAQKRAFETTKKLNIAMAVIDTIKGAVSAFTGMTSTIPGPVGIALGAIAAAGVVASGVANVKKIKDTKFEGGGSASASTGASVASSANATQPMQPQLFGQNNNQNNLTAPQDAEKPNNNMVVKAVVVESDVTATQARVKGIQSNATL